MEATEIDPIVLPDMKWYHTLGLFALSAAAVASLGWFLGPPKKENANQKSSRADELMVGEEENRQHEETLQQLMQKLNESMQRGNIARAEQQAQEILLYTENTWGKNHMNYGLLLGIPIATLYELKGDRKQLQSALQAAAQILKKHGDEYLVETNIADKLVTVYSNNNEYSKAVEYASLMVKSRRDTLQANPNNPNVIEKFCLAASKAGITLANAGQFRQAEAHYMEALKVHSDFDPVSMNAYNCLEYYTNALHQQARTQDAVVKLEEYKRKIAHLPNSAQTVRKILHRAAVLLFTVDKYSESLHYLKQVIKSFEGSNNALQLQILCELATVYWELNNESEAKTVQSQMKGFPLLPNNTYPLTRSKYLCTMDCVISNKECTLVMRINREQPNRKEGEQLEDTEFMKRKLDRCYLEISLESPQSNEYLPKIFQLVDKPHHFEIKYDTVHKVDPGRWYEAVITIYSDEKRENKLGVHHQLVYAQPEQNYKYVGKPTQPF